METIYIVLATFGPDEQTETCMLRAYRSEATAKAEACKVQGELSEACPDTYAPTPEAWAVARSIGARYGVRLLPYCVGIHVQKLDLE